MNGYSEIPGYMRLSVTFQRLIR